MENRTRQSKGEPEIELSAKDKILESVAVGMCFLLLMACFLKVMFF